MSVRTDLLTAVRDLIIGLTGATDPKVINSGASGPKPALPYLSIRIQSPDVGGLGPAERIDGLNGSTPEASMRAARDADVSVQGFGTTAADWLEDLEMLIDSPASLTLQATSKIAARVKTPTSDISVLIDTEEEARFELSLGVGCTLITDPSDQVELLSVEIDLDIERFDGDPDSLNYTTTIDLT